MAIWIKSKHPGIRYREHPTRPHGIGKNNKPDRYYTIFYKLDGKMVEEAVGWASQGMTEKKAVAMLSELQENHRRGSGPRTLREKKGLAVVELQKQADEEQAIRDRAEQAAKASIPLSTIFYDKYLPYTQANRRTPGTEKRDEGLFRLWIAPVIGDKPLREIAPFDLEKIKKAMSKAGRAERSIVYALAVVRQIFNFALARDLYLGKNPAGPAGEVKRPSKDNRRMRYLSREQAAILLAELETKSPNVHDMALLSLHTGMRAGEVFALTWADVDLVGGILLLKDTKSNKNRPAFMTEAVKAMLQGRVKSGPADLVFPGRNGKRIVQASETFTRVVEQMGLNEGISDRRQKVTFHTLRHTFASWLVQSGTNIYHVQELLGHSDLKLTARYAHIGENSLRAAVQRMETAG